MKKLIIGVVMMLLLASCATAWKKIPATMSGFENGKGSIKGPIKQEELSQSKISINFKGNPDVNEVIITPLILGEETFYKEDGGVVRVPNTKMKNVFTFITPTILKIFETTFFKGEEYPDKIDVFYSKDSISSSLPFILNINSGIYHVNVNKKIKEIRHVQRTKNGGTVPVLVYNEYGKKVPKITKKVLYETGQNGYIFTSPLDSKKYQINTKNLILDNIWMKNQKQKTKKIIIEGYKKPK